MKILLLTDGIYPFVMGGMQKHSYNLAKYLTTDENEITLLHCVDFRSNCPSSKEIQHLLFKGEKDNFKTHCVQFPQSNSLPGHYLRSSKKLSRKYWDIIGGSLKRYDFIFSQGFTAWEFLKNKDKCPPIGIHFHGYNSFQESFGLKQKLESFLLNWEIRSYANRTDYLFSLGGNISSLIQNQVPFNKEQILVSSNGIEDSWLSSSSKQFTGVRKFIFVGRPNKIKAIDLIYIGIQSLSIKAEFHFVGDFADEKKLKLPNVKYWGVVSSEEELKSIYNNMDVLLCPSFSEGLPTVILESMALGLPVIATDVGAVDEVVKNNINGRLISSGNKEEFLEALKYYCNLESSKLVEESIAAQETISNRFLWQNVIKDTIQSIKEAIKA